jgi:DNA-binding LacI/PurR family transcriptional regulator
MSDQKTPGFASAQEVAALAGVSRSAVSRVFTPGASVSAKTRERVLAAAETLGYHVNHLARGLIRQETGIVCVVGSDISTPYLSRMIDRLTLRLQDAGKIAMLINAAGRLERVEDALRQTLNYRAEATIVLSGTPDRLVAKTCIDSGQRLILLNRDDGLDGAFNIAVDNRRAAETAVSLLLDGGCQKLAVVSSMARTPSLTMRETFFIEAAARRGHAVQVARDGPTAHASGLASARRLLAGPDRPDGIFCVTDLLACGVMDGARFEFGLSVPADLAVIGFDDIEQAGWLSYDLTTFRQPVDTIAELCVALVTRGRPLQDDGRHLVEAPLVLRRTAGA